MLVMSDPPDDEVDEEADPDECRTEGEDTEREEEPGEYVDEGVHRLLLEPEVEDCPEVPEEEEGDEDSDDEREERLVHRLLLGDEDVCPDAECDGTEACEDEEGDHCAKPPPDGMTTDWPANMTFGSGNWEFAASRADSETPCSEAIWERVSPA